MKMRVTLVLVLWLGAFVPAFATPAGFGSKEAPAFRIIPLQQPDAAVASETLRSVVPQPKLRASPSREAPASSNINNRILYGNQASACQFPYQVALVINGETFCGGSLIDKSWILTAAHCIQNAQSVQVLAGNIRWRAATTVVNAKRAIVHTGFNDWANNDIGVLDLGQNIEDGDCIKSVELETEGCGTYEFDDVLGTVSGWGQTSDENVYVEEILRYVETKTVTNQLCYSYYGRTIIDSGICSISTVGANGTLCDGDSGGPLVWGEPPKQIGVNSFVSIYGCEYGWPSGYARVACFIDWIRAAQAM